jgi:hypothetical protein
MSVILCGAGFIAAQSQFPEKTKNRFSILDGMPASYTAGISTSSLDSEAFTHLISTQTAAVPDATAEQSPMLQSATTDVFEVAVPTAPAAPAAGLETLPAEVMVPVDSATVIPVAVSTSPTSAPNAVTISGATLDAYSLAVPTTTAGDIAGREFLEYLEEKQVLSYSRKGWNRVRSALEEGRPLVEEEKHAVAVSSAAKPAAQPLPPGLAVELPYESQLYISGRKLIGVNYKATIYDKPDPTTRINSSSFDMNQELQVRIKGRVGRKINVNVDFDDTKDDKRDISVVYKGDPDEVVQEAAFGDITMTLPSTEFVGYSRQLFGVKVDAKYKKLRTWGFFSRTKGLSEIKKFTGNTKLDRRTIPDTGYIGLKYYLLRFNSDVIKNGTVKVYQDDRNTANNNVNTSSNTIVESLSSPPTYYTGNFDLLVAGQDYTIDYERGIIAFRNRLGSNYVIAIDYQRTDGTFLSQSGTISGAPKIIKEETNNVAISRELRTFYNLGNVKIIRDNGRGNFILKVEDLNGAQPASTKTGQTTPVYPANINVDFEAGVFNFDPPINAPFPDDVYTSGNHHFNILTEYHYRVKFITLRAGIVPQSERVVMDGKQLKADQDYYIDYDAGIITFFNEDRITENTVIEISYDYAPFGGSGGSTLVGARSELSLTDNIFVGSSFIYDFAARTQSVPDIRTTPSSLMVWEGDARVKDIKLPYTPLTVSLGGEYALSSQNPNIMNRAIVESMEGIKQEDSASLAFEQWRPAVTPGGAPYYLSDVSWGSEQISRTDINPKLDLSKDDRQQVLSVSYDLGRETELSIIQPLSTIGMDFSKKQYLEAWIFGDGNGENLSFEYGTFREDINRDGIMYTEDKNLDNTLNAGEDVGWPFKNPNGTTTTFGAGNGRLDTEDFDNNGVLNTIDLAASPSPFGPVNGKTITDNEGKTYSAVTWKGWKLFRIPINMTNPDEWKAIKQLRLTVSGTGLQRGTVKFAGISLVGNRWEAVNGIAGSTVTVTAVNNETNPEYVSLLNNPEYRSLYDQESSDTSDEKREQALSISYTVPISTTVDNMARLTYGRAYDLSNYKHFKMFVYGNGHAEDSFVIQGGNDTNYFEYSIPIFWTGWRLISIPQVDINKDGKPEIWGANEVMASSRTVGAPSLQNISQFKVGVRTTGIRSGEIWVNEMHVTDSWKKDGYAWRANADFNWAGMGTFGGSRRQYNRDFQTFSAGVYNRDYLEDTGYANLSRFGFLPVSAKISRTLTVTPAVVQNQGDLVSILDEGRVVSYTGSGQANFNLGAWPRLGMLYSRAITDTQQIQRLEDRENYSTTFDYTNPVRFGLLPTSLSANYDLTNSFYRPWMKLDTMITDDNSFMSFGALNEYMKVDSYNTLEITESWGARTPFQFWKGFNFSPSYSLKTVKEKNNYFKPQREYPKTLNQSVAATASLKLFAWLQPNFSYNINTAENYNITYSTSLTAPVFPSQKKYIERNSAGEISWNFQVKDIFNYRYVQSLGFSSSYRMQDTDSYDNVDSSFTAIGTDKLWIRNKPLLQPLQGGTTGYVVKSLVRKDDIRISGRYNPFEAFSLGGRLSPLKTLTANFTYTGNEEHSYITGTTKDVFTRVWPDLVFSMGQLERMIWLEKWFSDSQFNLKHQRRITETATVSNSESKSYGGDWRFNLLRRIDMSLTATTSHSTDFDIATRKLTSDGENVSWSTQGSFNVKKWRFTLRYDNTKDLKKDGTGKLTTDILTDTYLWQLYYDLTSPRGLRLPFIRRTLPLTNRMIVNSNLKYATRRSSLNIEKDNTNTYGLNANADYEVSQNFRLSIGVAWNRIENVVKADESYSTIEASSKLTIQF